jgi:hypothetical protein
METVLFQGGRVHDYWHCRGDLFDPFGSMEALKQGKKGKVPVILPARSPENKDSKESG